MLGLDLIALGRKNRLQWRFFYGRIFIMATPKAGIAWKAFTVADKTYDLSHLHPTTQTLAIPAKGNAPERHLSLAVSYSLHCFTRRSKEDESVPNESWYSDDREQRVFDEIRWQLSFHLPAIVSTLESRRCLHTGHEEFVTVSIIHEGRELEYAVFFTVSKGKKSGADLNLFINSAHERTEPLKYTKPIRFQFIALNRYLNKPIKSPV